MQTVCKDNANQLFNDLQTGATFYLTDLAKAWNQKRDMNWDEKKELSVRVANKIFFSTGNLRLTERVLNCADKWQFIVYRRADGSKCFKMPHAWFCDNRFCCICQAGKAIVWSARFLKALPNMLVAHSGCSFILGTFTLRNCPIGELRSTISDMNAAWRRVTDLKAFPALGWLKALEVTAVYDCYQGEQFLGRHGMKWIEREQKRRRQQFRLETAMEAHPHFHILMMVDSNYFGGRTYLSHDKWVEMWQKSLRVDYQPVCDVRKVRNCNNVDGIHAAVRETVKYSTKPADVIGSSDEWFAELMNQMVGVKAVSLGGCVRNFVRDLEPEGEDYLHEFSEDDVVEIARGFAWYNPLHKRYQAKLSAK